MSRFERILLRTWMALSRIRGPHGRHAWFAGMEDTLVAEVGFVTLVADVAD